uniref:DUF659 domain-containing protein n=1 Tax=Chenopodium quinoa TaxID=63459 RepID=A0A803M2T3_CHEQI
MSYAFGNRFEHSTRRSWTSEADIDGGNRRLFIDLNTEPVEVESDSQHEEHVNYMQQQVYIYMNGKQEEAPQRQRKKANRLSTEGRFNVLMFLMKYAGGDKPHRGAIKVASEKFNICTSVFRMIQIGDLKAHTNALKQKMTEANKLARLKWVLELLMGSTAWTKNKYFPIYDFVHIAEKWFNLSRKSQRYYLSKSEKGKHRAAKSSIRIPKAMLMAATSRPSMSSSGSTFAKKRKNATGSRSDPGWEHGFQVDNDTKKTSLRQQMLDAVVEQAGEENVVQVVTDNAANYKAVGEKLMEKRTDWWESYGDECLELQRFAIRIFSLTCSSSGCERNWSAFEIVHTKKRNRLHQQRMNDLVFITEIEEPVLPTGGEWFDELDRAARRFTRQAIRDENESLYREVQDNVVEVQTLSDDDDPAEGNEAAATFIGSNEIDLDDFGVVDDTDVRGTTTGIDIGSDDVDGGSFGFDDY